jgi:outer membrane protein assembly factor BamB
MKTANQVHAFILFALCLLTGCSPTTLPAPATQHGIESITELGKAWELSNVYITQERFAPITGAADGKFCFLGNFSNQAERKIVCLNSLRGDLVWEKLASSSSAFAISPKGVFIGSTGIAGVIRYDLDGRFIWDDSFTGNGVLRIYVVGNELQVFNHPEKLRVFDIESGQLTRQIKGDTIYISTETEEFIYTNTLTLQSVEPSTGKIKWEANIKDYIRISPLFTEDVIYVREGEIIGRVYAINRTDGKILWRTDDNVITNIAYSPKKERIYVLTRDGKLMSIDKNSGETNTLIQFSNSPFVLNGDQQVGGYEVAYDNNANILIVTLGDSRQVFAFQEQ